MLDQVRFIPKGGSMRLSTKLILVPLLVLATPLAASVGQASHILWSPANPVFGQWVDFAWNGAGDDVRFDVTCHANDTTVPAQPLGTVVQYGYGVVTEDEVPEPLSIPMGPTDNWTSGGADCTIYADIFSYSGSSGKYQRKFASAVYTVSP
jgi:hypothetical protein